MHQARAEGCSERRLTRSRTTVAAGTPNDDGQDDVPRSASSLRRVFVRLAVNGMAALLLLAAVELGLRLRGDVRTLDLGSAQFELPGWLAEDDDIRTTLEQIVAERDNRARAKAHEAYLRFIRLFEPNARLHYALRSDLNEQIVNWQNPRQLELAQTWTLDTNESGFRGPRLESGGAGERPRIACIGASVTYGWGVEPNDAFPARLAQLMREDSACPPEVFNLGSPGFTSLQGVMLIDELLDSGIDLVVCNFGNNDLELAEREEKETNRMMVTALGRFATVLSELRLARLLRVRTIRIAEASSAARDRPRVPRVSLDDYRSNLRHIADRVRSAGGKLIFLDCLRSPMGGPEERATRERYAAATREVAEVTGCAFLSFGDIVADECERQEGSLELEPLIAEAEGTWGPKLTRRHPRLLFQVDRLHPSPLGHELIAAAIHTSLLESGWDAASPKRGER
jgi:lysophospholipase L1-like esterase